MHNRILQNLFSWKTSLHLQRFSRMAKREEIREHFLLWVIPIVRYIIKQTSEVPPNCSLFYCYNILCIATCGLKAILCWQVVILLKYLLTLLVSTGYHWYYSFQSPLTCCVLVHYETTYQNIPLRIVTSTRQILTKAN